MQRIRLPEALSPKSSCPVPWPRLGCNLCTNRGLSRLSKSDEHVSLKPGSTFVAVHLSLAGCIDWGGRAVICIRCGGAVENVLTETARKVRDAPGWPTGLDGPGGWGGES
jgi:hypothetical protein